jgi:hypothetical protein
MRARKLEITFNASGAAEAGARGRVVAVVDVVDSSTSAEAAMSAGAAAACFVTTARVAGRTGWDLVGIGARRAIALADEHGRDLTIVAASANSADDCLAAFEIGRRVITEGFLRV